ncbi:MAG: ligase-associated DNA damage response exonuclease [Lautropia sp.]
MADLITRRPEGLYCPEGDFYIDPWRPVERAVITHAHADHARTGHRHYLAQRAAEGVLRARLGEISLQSLDYGEPLRLGGARVSLHPAGHVLGSAQVRVEVGGEVWVASGDYFVAGEHDADAGAANPTCAPFEPVRCDTFITESTFGLPIYRWAPDARVFADVDAWWDANRRDGRASLLLAYSFGKAQRLLAGVDASIGPILLHPAVERMTQAYRDAGVALPTATALAGDLDRKAARGALVIAPPAVHGSAWARRLGEHGDAFASGWMRLRGARRRRGVDRGFVLSDHADWPGLVRAIRATGASRVIVTHGYEDAMVRWLGEQGLQASRFETEYGDDAVEDDAPPPGSAP